MKRYLLTFLIVIVFSGCHRDSTTYSEDHSIKQLEGLCKLWGFLKYYHPTIGANQKNWDSLMLVNIKPILKSVDDAKYQKMLLDLIPPIKESRLSNNIENPFFQNLNIDFISDTSLFSPKIINILSMVLANKTTFDNYYIEPSTYAENPSLTKDTAYNSTICPSVEIRLLSLFRIWNIINYYYPYKYLVDCDWDDVLIDFIPEFIKAKDTISYHLVVRRLVSNISDNHVYANSKILSNFFGEYLLPFELRNIQGAPTIFKFYSDSLERASPLKIGDIIVGINGENIRQKQDQLYQYISGSNHQKKMDKINYYLCKSTDSLVNFSIIRENKNISANSVAYPKRFIRQMLSESDEGKYSNDITRGITYVNLRSIKYHEIDSVFQPLLDRKVLILDLRENCNFILHDLCNLIFNDTIVFYSYLTPDYNFPGVFNINNDGITGSQVKNKYSFSGKLIILINERTQSIGEFTAMALKKYNSSLFIGSTTAGADGNVSIASLPGEIKVYFSGLGIYYPGFGQTQRVGIQPNISLKPTLKGIINGQDEVLEFAIKQAKQYIQ